MILLNDLTFRPGSELTPSAAPVMLVSNCPEYQETAVTAGAVLGFGKAEIRAADTRAKLGALLS